MPYGIIYKVTNLINGKIYIGQTAKTLHERRLQHFRDSKRVKNNNIALYNAFNKYGADNFNWCIIDEGNSRGDLDEKEVYWIEYYDSYIHSENTNGYNMNLGGGSRVGYVPTKETISKIKDKRKGWKHSKETKEKIRNSHIGKIKTKEHCKNISKSKKGKKIGDDSPRAKAVIRLSLDGCFIERHPTVSDGARSVNGSTTKISRCCMGLPRYKTHKGFKWMYEEDYLSLEK